MSKKIALLSLLIILSNYCWCQSPNILLIIADDLGVDAINGYNIGSFDPETPHLDSIRNAGVTFSNAWSSPVCTPTRAGIMSGMYGSKNGVKTAPENLDTSFTSIFKAIKTTNSNYNTAVTGKWHISKPVNELHPTWHGVDHYMGVMSGAVTSYNNWEKTENNITTNDTNYVTTYFTDNAISWINNQNNPWFLWLAHIAPHTPIHIPPSHMFTQPSTNSVIKKYIAMIESLDFEIGRLLDSLTPSEKANTTIIFIGDNGTPNNVLQDYPSNHGKESLYQGGIHVPMLVSGYGVTRIGETEHALVNVIDIYATILELAGNNLPGGVNNSLSFKHLLTNSTQPKRLYNFSELDSNQTSISNQGYTIRDNTYKLIEYHDGSQEMYNLILDTLETNNLLLGNLSTFEQALKLELETEANQRKNAWSCKDYIQNGDEDGIDCGGTYCAPCSTVGSKTITNVSEVIIYPNPAFEALKIDVKTSYMITIKTLQGKVVFTSDIKPGLNTIPIKGLSSGMYLIEGVNSISRFDKKLLIH